jgi:dihydrofolate synthase / folylpolyglutamate synthase
VEYTDAIAYLQSLSDMEMDPAQAFAPVNFDLRRMESLLERLGSPHLGRRTIHVAGSKGKGSTAGMIAAIVRMSGHEVGLYTSPHLHRYEERISVSGSPVSSDGFAVLVEGVRPAVEAESSQGSLGAPSTFESLTAMAFLAFQDAACSHQVLEVGLGGRLDATNVAVGPKLCVITPIGLEHTAILGETVAAIAVEKAGIIPIDGDSAQCDVVMSPQRESAADVVRERCLVSGATLHEVAASVRMRVDGLTLDGRRITLETARQKYDFRLSLLARSQAENAATAILASELVMDDVAPAAVKAALADYRLPGRQELIKRRPHILVDVAHTEDSVKSLVTTLNELRARNVTLVFAPLADKRLQAMAQSLAPMAGEVIATSAPHPRAAPIEAVAAAFDGLGVTVLRAPGVEEALGSALSTAQDDDWVVVAGSFAAVAAARAHLLGLTPPPT